MTSFVFAYGSNMCSGRFREYKVTALGPGRAALLEGFTLKFNKRSTDGSGKATVYQSPGDSVWGVLYEIPTADLPTLDDGERGYVRENATVLVGGEQITAWLYTARRPDETMRLRPFSWYKRFIVEGAREHILPPEYIIQLEGIEYLTVPDRARHNDRMALRCSGNAPGDFLQSG
jgi:gamma-glutamylcyclotransferase